MDPNCPTFNEFCKIENTLPKEIAKTYEGVMSIHECEIALKTMENNKTPGTDGLPLFLEIARSIYGKQL